MQGEWRSAFQALENFIAQNPEITIRKGITLIPKELNEGFYTVFNQVRKAFIREKTPQILIQALEVSDKYKTEVAQLMPALEISEIKMPSKLDWMITDPLNGLIRPLRDPLFMLLKKELTLDDFEDEAARLVASYALPIIKMGYEKWLIMAIASLLKPDQALAIPYDEMRFMCHELQPDEKKGFFDENVLEPQKLETLLLGHEGYDPSFMMSDIIVRESTHNRYIAFGADLTDCAWSAKNATTRREWITIRSKGLESRPRLEWPSMVLYIDNQPKTIGLISDFSRFLRPDIIIECMDDPEWYEKGEMDIVQRNYDSFKPIMGSFIVTKYPIPTQVAEALSSQKASAETAPLVENEPENQPASFAQPEEVRNIRIVEVGFDKAALTPIIDILVPAPEAKTE
ncbi:MAG: hypothetical protein GX602_04985 [Dehalococcoidales bacterium]|nr:hypothetical protein [Dehalococcoidales bacterium]